MLYDVDETGVTQKVIGDSGMKAHTIEKQDCKDYQQAGGSVRLYKGTVVVGPQCYQQLAKVFTITVLTC